MPDREFPSSAILEALGFAVFLREESGGLKIAGRPPEWLHSIWPNEALPIAEASPFLENFLVDAATCWAAGGEQRARSGPWVEQMPDGSQLSLEATALSAEGQSILLLERLGETFEVKKSMLQKARETAIAYQRLESEMQKKEILLNCVADEMSVALANVITALRLIELESNPVRARQLLALASRATEEQQGLIKKVLEVFAAEWEGLYGGDRRERAEIGQVLRGARDNVSPRFAEKGVGLQIGESHSETCVSANAGQLSRVLTNLLENALQNSLPESQVNVVLVEEADALLVQVLDAGPAMSPDLIEDFFSQSKLGSLRPEASQLRMQFCRIAVENFQGEMGCERHATGENCCWIRLPKVLPNK